MLNSHWGRTATSKKVLHLCKQSHFSSIQIFTSLHTVACHASRSGRAVMEARILECICQYWMSYHSKALYFLLPYLPNPLKTCCCQNSCDPSSFNLATPGPHRGKPKSSRADSGANPSGQPTCRGGNKTTVETQGEHG